MTQRFLRQVSSAIVPELYWVFQQFRWLPVPYNTWHKNFPSLTRVGQIDLRILDQWRFSACHNFNVPLITHQSLRFWRGPNVTAQLMPLSNCTQFCARIGQSFHRRLSHGHAVTVRYRPYIRRCTCFLGRNSPPAAHAQRRLQHTSCHYGLSHDNP